MAQNDSYCVHVYWTAGRHASCDRPEHFFWMPLYAAAWKLGEAGIMSSDCTPEKLNFISCDDFKSRCLAAIRSAKEEQACSSSKGTPAPLRGGLSCIATT